MNLVSELKRRNVLRMAALYMVAAWLIIQVASELIDLGNLPEWVGPPVLILLAIGFPIALTLSWFYEITPKGIGLERDIDSKVSVTDVGGRRLDFIVISLLLAAVFLLAYDKWRPTGPAELSIAVLPFENLTADPDQEYFSDGISDELLNSLAKMPELRVISRHSSFAFKGEKITVPEIAEQLNVTHVLEGSVRRAGDRIRITAQLIDTSTDSHLWSESYDRRLDDIFVVEDDIVSSISAALKLNLLAADDGLKQPAQAKTSSVQAYEAYLRGRELIVRRERYDEAIDHLEYALRLDPDFAQAHAQLAIAIILNTGPLELRARGATPHLDRAQVLQPDLAEAHGGRALLAMLAGDPEAAIGHAKRALASNPNYVDAMNWLQMSLVTVGRFEDATAIRNQMMVVDPLNVIGRFNYSWYLGATGRIEEAHRLADGLIEQSRLRGYLAHAQISLIWEGDIERAVFWFLKAESEIGGDLRRFPPQYFVSAFVWVGLHDEARRVKGASYLVDVAEGLFDDAIRSTQERMAHNLTPVSIQIAANTLYEAGRFDEALPLYERLRDFVPEGTTIGGRFASLDLHYTMRLAFARRMAGDENGAQAAAGIVRLWLIKRGAEPDRVDGGNQRIRAGRALLAAFNEDSERAITELESAVRLGLRDPLVLRDPIFDDLSGSPEFVAIQKELDAILAAEREQVLQLVCFNNPTPDNWQPLPATCDGVVRQDR